jgi:streptogramin lyase
MNQGRRFFAMRSTKRSCRSTLAFASAFLITACQGGSVNPVNAVPPQSYAIQPTQVSVDSIDRRGKCRLGKIHIYNGPSASGGVVQVTADGKGNIWYGEIGSNQIVKFSRQHRFTSYPIPTANAKPEGIAVSRRRVWFTEWNLPNVGRFARGRFKEYNVPALSGGQSQAVDIIAGPDKRMWFTTDLHGIGAITSRGQSTLYSIQNNGEQPSTLALGPDKNIWFTEFAGPNIGKITRNGAVTEYNVGGGQNNYGITAGPDGRIWFTDWNNFRIGTMKTDGSDLKYYPVPSGNPAEITLRKKDGKLYFTAIKFNGPAITGSFIGQITTKGVVRECAIKVPTATAFAAFGIVENPVGHAMFFVDNSSVSRLGELDVR